MFSNSNKLMAILNQYVQVGSISASLLLLAVWPSPCVVTQASGAVQPGTLTLCESFKEFARKKPAMAWLPGSRRGLGLELQLQSAGS